MTTDLNRVKKYLEYLIDVHDESSWKTRLRPRTGELPPSVPRGRDEDAVEARWKTLGVPEEVRTEIADADSIARREVFDKNVENFIGTVKVPVGVAGPLRVNGMFAQGDYYVPLATVEPTLVASYNRGAQVMSEAGGVTTLLLNEGVGRAPGFAFENLMEAGIFVMWVMSERETIKEVAEQTTRYGKLIDLRLNVEGNHVYFIFDFVTADASGQNMSTIASEAICSYVNENSPIKPKFSFVESNFSGDKKLSSQSFQSVRGKKVTAEVLIPRELVEKGLNTTAKQMARYFQFSTIGCILSGTIGTQGHYANGLTALYLACGQDAACAAESAVGVTRFEDTDSGDLYGCVTLPNLMVATVGGGTGLPSQAACLDVVGLRGKGQAHAFAEIAAGLCLAGELSIAAAVTAGEFTRAHQVLARGTKENGGR